MIKIYKINNHLSEYRNSFIDYKVNYNPLNLPANTLRCKFKNGYTPSMGDSQTLVDTTNNIWDIYKSGNDWHSLFLDCNDLLEVLGANTTNIICMDGLFCSCTSLILVALFDTSNVTSMGRMFLYCSSLTSIPLFNTINVTDMGSMFDGCSSLTTIPLFNTSNVTYMTQMFYGCSSLFTVPLLNTFNVTSMDLMFYGCTNVEDGALALYQQASSQTNPPTSHSRVFYNCGSNTVNGSAELAQIPSNWK